MHFFRCKFSMSFQIQRIQCKTHVRHHYLPSTQNTVAESFTANCDSFWFLWRTIFLNLGKIPVWKPKFILCFFCILSPLLKSINVVLSLHLFIFAKCNFLYLVGVLPTYDTHWRYSFHLVKKVLKLLFNKLTWFHFCGYY